MHSARPVTGSSRQPVKTTTIDSGNRPEARAFSARVRKSRWTPARMIELFPTPLAP